MRRQENSHRTLVPVLVGVLVVMVMASACSNLGLGEADCTPPARDISASNILTVQAVPTATYTPCLRELRLGWDSVEWFAEDGRAGIEISKDFNPFLSATVTESCDVSEAEAVAADARYPDIQRFEDVEFQQAEIEVAIIPSGDGPLTAARRLVSELARVQVDDRPVKYTIDSAVGETVSSRSERALSELDYVWIIDELDVEEGTVQLRSNNEAAAGHGLEPDDALDLIEDVAPKVFYRGSWYFTFDGGCITYEFNADGVLAETVAADAEDAIGFYPALELREGARDAGLNIE